jgi:transcriptional regulator with XRE-family HTH domain
MSLRKLAKELGVSHTLLVLWRQGKRTLAPEIEARYWALAPAHVTSGEGWGIPAEGGNKEILSPPRLPFRHPG